MAKKYEISEEHFTGALDRLVQQFKRENPSIGKFEATCHDGSKVTIKIKNLPVKDMRPLPRPKPPKEV